MRLKVLIAFLLLLLCGAVTPAYYFFADRPDSSLVWGAKLRSRLRNCDAVIVRSGNPDDGQPDRRILFKSRDRGLITNLVASLQTIDHQSGAHCGCVGNPTIEFFHGWNKLATVGMHHGKLLRWDKGWAGDGMLTKESSTNLLLLLKQHGLTDTDLE
jgi:hypothetical protein